MGKGAFNHLGGVGLLVLHLADEPFPRLAEAQPLQRGARIGREGVAIRRVDGVVIAGLLEDPHRLEAAPARE